MQQRTYRGIIGGILPVQYHTERKIIMRSEDQRIIEEITNKAVKNALAEMEQAKPKPITTTLGYMNVTSAEIDKSSGMEFYINVSEVSDAWIEVIQKAVYIDRFHNKEANRYGADWCDAGVNTLIRLHVTINPDWKVSIRLEVYYEDKEKDYMFGTVYFKVNIADDVALKEIIVDAIRSRLSQ